ncbi:unnamed protein product [Vicia faba]|uniref:Uncharacterized protein n=1 Tax=Vicia faba TaxID=3906 RepID=A0AAV0Z7L3_VICFA|nr:unnamed protein product [Vicia faba]
MSKVFYNLYTTKVDVDNWIQIGYSYPLIEVNVVSKLNKELKDDEMKELSLIMAPWKSPGPDGYPASFFQQSWNMVGNNIEFGIVIEIGMGLDSSKITTEKLQFREHRRASRGEESAQASSSETSGDGIGRKSELLENV